MVPKLVLPRTQSVAMLYILEPLIVTSNVLQKCIKALKQQLSMETVKVCVRRNKTEINECS